MLRRTLTTLTLTILTTLSVTTGTTATAHANTPVARPESVTVKYATTTTVNVLKNDTVTTKTNARVTLVKVAPALKATIKTKQLVVVTVPYDTKQGTYPIRYRVADSHGHTATATLSVKVAPKTLQSLIKDLPVATEIRTGYNRDLYNHWTSQGNGCDTRDMVLITEAANRTLGDNCTYTGTWSSYYDGVTTTDPGSFDVDHMVPLAEAHDSGAYAWDADTRQRFANDLADPRSLVAVTASSNRSKSDQDPAEWMPARNTCRYLTEFVIVKTRWSLTTDTTEKNALATKAANCAPVTLTFTKAPVTKATTTTPPPTTGGDLTLTRIDYDPAGADTTANLNQELVAITNHTTAAITMTGWVLTDAASAKYTFPAKPLAAGATILIHSGTGTDISTDHYANWGFVWNNSTDTATLTRPDGTVADTCTYTGDSTGTTKC